MLYRGMPRRAAAEMAIAIAIWAFALLLLGWLAILPKENLALMEHCLMMPIMLSRLDPCTGPAGPTSDASG